MSFSFVTNTTRKAFIGFIIVFLFSVLAAGKSQADQIVKFQLYNVVFSDGNSAIGTFVYDFTTDSMVNVAIYAEGGIFNNSKTSSTDVDRHTIAGSYDNNQVSLELQLTFVSSLDPVKGTVISTNPTLSFLAGNARVSVVSGSVIPSAYFPQTSASLSGKNGLQGWYRGPVQVTLSVKPGIKPVANTYYILDGGATQVYSAPFTVNGDAYHTVEFWSVDIAGLTEYTHYVYPNIDSTSPTTTIYRSGESLYVTAYDNLSGIFHTYYTMNGGTTQISKGLIIAPVGNDTIIYWTEDIAGNLEPAQSLSFTTGDTIPPTPPGKPHIVSSNASYVTIKWTASTDNVKVAGYEVDYEYCKSGKGGGCSWRYITFTTSTTVTVPNKYYELGVLSIDTSGNRSYISIVK